MFESVVDAPGVGRSSRVGNYLFRNQDIANSCLGYMRVSASRCPLATAFAIWMRGGYHHLGQDEVVRLGVIRTVTSTSQR
jgi:hypothetical protein